MKPFVFNLSRLARNANEKEPYELVRYVEKEIQLDERLINLDISHFRATNLFHVLMKLYL